MAQRVEMGPGEISFGEDQNTRGDRTAGRAIAPAPSAIEPAVLMVVQFARAAPSPAASPLAGESAAMDGFEIMDRRFAHYVLGNAPLEELATGFRWIEGPVWMGDADCLLFQDIPRNRTMRWIEDGGVSVFRAPSRLRQRADARPAGPADRLLASRPLPLSHRT